MSLVSALLVCAGKKRVCAFAGVKILEKNRTAARRSRKANVTQISTREKTRLKDRTFSFAQKEALPMPEVILSDYFYGDESTVL